MEMFVNIRHHTKKLLFFAICLLQKAYSYETKCPDYSQHRLMSKMCSSIDKFHCLYDGSSRYFIHKCRNWDWVSKGFYPVLSGIYIDYVPCSSDTYQPFAYPSYEDHKCQLKKSLCNEKGQMTVDGTTTNDSNCRCDHTKGYAFVSWSIYSHCGPFEDDCSCYLKTCPSSETLNKDYICERKDSKHNTEREGNIEPSFRLNSTIIGISGLIYQQDFIWSDYLHETRRYTLCGFISCVIIFIISLAVSVASQDEIYKTDEKHLELECTDAKSKRFLHVAERHTDVASLTPFKSFSIKPDKSEQATITINLKRLSGPIPLGSNVTLHGSISSSDNIISVKWQVQGNSSTTLSLFSVKQIKKRTGEFIQQESVKYISSSDLKVPSLTIKNVDSIDEGVYSCLVSTQHRMVQSNNVQLTVKGNNDPINPLLSTGSKRDLPIVFTQKTVDVKPGVTGIIPCDVQSTFTITSVTWHKHVGDSIALIDTSARKYTCEIIRPSLIISNVDSSDEGMYSCDVTNSNGTTQSDMIALNVVSDYTT